MRVAVIWGDTRTVLLAEIFSFLYCSVWIEQSMICDITLHSSKKREINCIYCHNKRYIDRER